MKRTEVYALLYYCLNLIRYENRARELLSAMEHSMSYRSDFINRLNNTELLINKSCKHKLKRLCMSRNIDRYLIILLALRLKLKTAISADFLADTLCNNLLCIHINELEFKRRASCINYQNFHFNLHSAAVRAAAQRMNA